MRISSWSFTSRFHSECNFYFPSSLFPGFSFYHSLLLQSVPSPQFGSVPGPVKSFRHSVVFPFYSLFKERSRFLSRRDVVDLPLFPYPDGPTCLSHQFQIPRFLNPRRSTHLRIKFSVPTTHDARPFYINLSTLIIFIVFISIVIIVTPPATGGVQTNFTLIISFLQ